MDYRKSNDGGSEGASRIFTWLTDGGVWLISITSEVMTKARERQANAMLIHIERMSWALVAVLSHKNPRISATISRKWRIELGRSCLSLTYSPS